MVTTAAICKEIARTRNIEWRYLISFKIAPYSVGLSKVLVFRFRNTHILNRILK